MRPLAERTTRIASSPTMQVTATVDRMRREGIDVIDFGTGEPDFATPAHVAAAAHRAIDEDFTKYTPVGGIHALKRAVCERYRLDYGVQYRESDVIITAGGKQALFNAALALFGPGDEVVLHGPSWPTLPEQVRLADAVPVVVDTRADEGFAIRAERLLGAVTPRTRGIIINSPANPTGALMPEPELTLLAREAARRELWIVLDLCYEKLIYPTDTGERVAHNLPAVLAAHCPEQSVICGSTSKAYAMTGWRCGWAIGPSAVIGAQSAIQSHATSNVASITQCAALEALTGPQDSVARMLDEFHRRRDSVHAWLNATPRYRAHKPQGAFYLFLDVTELLSPYGLRTSAEFAQALLEQSHVAVTPGEAFGAPGFVRISFATSMDLLREGSRRMVEFAQARTGQVTAG